jgi:hypothetical protein
MDGTLMLVPTANTFTSTRAVLENPALAAAGFRPAIPPVAEHIGAALKRPPP